MIFSIFRRDKEGGRNRLLKKIGRDIQRNRLNRFYNPHSMEVQPGTARIFYDFYKTISHAQVFLQNAERSRKLKPLTVESLLDLKFLDARQRLSADYVEEQANKGAIAQVSQLLKEDLAIFSGAFDAAFISRADGCYNRILAFIRFAAFDYYAFLRKFDPSIQERNFDAVPRFRPIRGELVVEELKEFLDAAASLDGDSDWSAPLRILKAFKDGIDVIEVEDWIQVLSQLRAMRQSSILELIIRHVTRDPAWEFKPLFAPERIAAAYLDERRQEVDDAMLRFYSFQKKNQVNSLVRELFGEANPLRLQNYSEKDSESFMKIGVDGFAYTQPLNYLYAFLEDFFQQDMQDLCELILIRGHWSSVEQSRNLSEIFHTLLDNTGRIQALEQSLGEEGEESANIQAALVKSSRNTSQLHNLTRMIRAIDENVWELISGTSECLYALGGYFKEILQDSREDAVYITNYRELQKESNPPLAQRIILNYKRIYMYLQIQRLLVGKDDFDMDPLIS